MKKIQLALSAIAAIGLSAFAASASAAAELFQEDFDGIEGGYCFFCSEPVNAGIPKISEGADEVWYGARIETPDSGSIDSDLAVQKNGGGSNTTHTGRFEDDAGLLFKVSTVGFDNVTLSFDWRTFLAATTDKFVVGYHIGPISGFGSCTGQGEAGCFNSTQFSNSSSLKWYTDEASTILSDNWSQLIRSSASDTWTNQSYLLPDAVENQAEVWFAFWLDNGEDDHGKLDNVSLTATVVPVPPAVWLFGTGLLGLVGVARRRKIV